MVGLTQLFIDNKQTNFRRARNWSMITQNKAYLKPYLYNCKAQDLSTMHVTPKMVSLNSDSVALDLKMVTQEV
jgi:hypothetical protein